MGAPSWAAAVPAQVTLFRGAGLTLARSEASTCRSGSPSLGRKEESQASLNPAPPARRLSGFALCVWLGSGLGSWALFPEALPGPRRRGDGRRAQ